MAGPSFRRWLGILIMMTAISIIIVPPLEKIYQTEGGVPGFFFAVWVFGNIAAMIGLSVYYSKLGSRMAQTLNLLGTILLYGSPFIAFGNSQLQVIFIILAFGSFTIAAYVVRIIPRWVLIVWLLAIVTAIFTPIIPQVGLFELTFNWWNLGLGLAPFGVGYTLWKQPKKQATE